VNTFATPPSYQDPSNGTSGKQGDHQSKGSKRSHI
jgi:hypothetical protein